MSAMSARRAFSLVVGLVMVGIGGFVAIRPLWAGPRPLSASRWLDVAFAFFFLLRGAMHLRSVLAPARGAGPPPGGPPARG
jgi:hypothetical protein